jgi:hypothetical protein
MSGPDAKQTPGRELLHYNHVRPRTCPVGNPTQRLAVPGCMSDDPLDHMRERIERCRRLANYINDPRTTEALLQMAEQGELILPACLRSVKLESVGFGAIRPLHHPSAASRLT